MSIEIKPGDKFVHFKGNVYEVICLGEHTETGETMVVYKAINTGKIYARPFNMFISPVDKEKYPDVKQEMRFEKILELKQHIPEQIK